MVVKTQNFPAGAEISSIPRGVTTQNLGFYLHIPFCKSKCTYCAFISGSPRSNEQMDRYGQALVRHIERIQQEEEKRALSSIFLGGGTPSLFGAQRLIPLFETIYETFSVKEDAEISIEVNPESASYELFCSLASYGLNRVSIGAQSFHDEELSRLGRVHSSELIKTAVENAREAGIDNISLDLIYAIPGQTLSGWEWTLQQALRCKPDHLSAYGLSYEEGTLMERLLTTGKITPVLDESYIEMYDLLCQTMEVEGFHHYELSNWCLPDKACRHNLLYWNRDDYLAVGVSACGTYKGIRYGVIDSSDEYIKHFERNNEYESFLQSDLLKEHIVLDTNLAASDQMIFGLRLKKGIDVKQFTQRFGYSPFDRWKSIIEKHLHYNRLELDDGKLCISQEALVISNEVLADFLD